MMFFKTRIAGTGSYLPEKVLTNHELEKMVETNDAWIVDRTGIKLRHIAAPNQATTDLAFVAARQALDIAGIEASNLDMIIFATVSPDYHMPSSACVLQAKLGAGNCVAWDLNAACSGFVYGSSVAWQYIRTGQAKNVLVVGAEVLSRFINFKDRETCILFGDGAGAAVFTKGDEHENSDVICESLKSDGRLAELLTIPAGGSLNPITKEGIDQNQQFVTMRGREIFKNAVRAMARCAEDALHQHNIPASEINWVIPHQANLRIIEAVAKQVGIPMSKVIVNIEHTGNTSGASVPIALDENVRSGLIKRGDLILIPVFGAGLTSGAWLIRY